MDGLERMIDIACRRYGFDRLELRRRNLVSPDAMPYRNPLGLVYDSGNYRPGEPAMVGETPIPPMQKLDVDPLAGQIRDRGAFRKN
jgi:hypothetical protein